MGRIIQKQVTYKIDYKSDVIYFPIRHHSPICSIHLKKVINEYKPDCILIEAPANANMIKKYLTEKEVEYPIALYCSHKVDDDYYSAYYPLLSYSPELVALKEAELLNIKTEFIDLPFVSRIMHSKKECGVNKANVDTSLSDDYLVSTNTFIEEIYKRDNCRNFDEFWEKTFEINCLNKSTQQFIEEFNTYTFYLRELTSKESLENDAILVREEYMYNKILEAKEDYKKVLVVCGGFHVHGFLEKDVAGVVKKEVDSEYTEMYILPYSMQQADATNGYASGMRAVNYYNEVYKELNLDVNNAYDNVNLKFLNQVSNKCTENKLLVTIPDKVSAHSISQGLSSLRGKTQAGKYELMDCITSSFVKGELNKISIAPLEYLDEVLVGTKIGVISANAPTPPIYKDFTTKCEMFNLNLQNEFEHEEELFVFSNEKHRDISRFLHQLLFLNSKFCRKKRGSTIKDRTDRNLIKEVWGYKYDLGVRDKLLTNAMYGATVSLAAKNYLIRLLKDCECSTEAALLLIDSFLMGLKHYDNFVFDQCYMIINSESSFFDSCDTLQYLVQLKQLSTLYKEENSLDYDKLIDICFNKCMYSLPMIAGVSEDFEVQVVSKLKLLFEVITSSKNKNYLNDFIEILMDLLNDSDLNPCIEGGILGILFSLKSCSVESIARNFTAYLNDVEFLSRGTRYLNGVFKTAREVIFISKIFINELDKLIDNISEEDFLQLLPDFRLSFSNFVPSEINKISKKVKDLYKEQMNKVATEEDIEYAAFLNEYVLEKLKELE